MNVAIDLGNTFAKVGWFEQNQLIQLHDKLSYQALADLLHTSEPEHIALSSVGQKYTDFIDLLQPKAPILTLTHSTPLPLRIAYDTPHTLGTDRIAATAGAQWLYPNQNALVIDMGSCITYDRLSKEGVFLGGSISPGMYMRFKAMHTFTKRLPLIEPEEVVPLVGKSTREAMLSGVINGLAAELNGLIEAYLSEYNQGRIVLCGGDARFFESRIKHPIFVVPELVLIGLNTILQYNLQNKTLG